MMAVMDRPQVMCEHRDGCDQPATHQVRMPGWPVLSVCETHAAQAKRMNFDVEPIK